MKSDRAKAEDDLVKEKDRSKAEIDALQKTIAALKDEKAQAEILAKKGWKQTVPQLKNDTRRNSQEPYCRKRSSLKRKRSGSAEKSEAASALLEIKTKNKQLAAEKALILKSIEELEAKLVAKDPASNTSGASALPATPKDPKKGKFSDKKVDSPGTLGKQLF